MRLDFQKNIASSQFTLPIVSILSAIIWLFVPKETCTTCSTPSLGLWPFIPSTLTEGNEGMLAAFGLSAFGVYLLAELNNHNVLLRISSRMLSSMLAAFFGLSLCLHSLGPGHVVMVFYTLSLFTLFTTYQMPLTMHTFVTYFLLSAGSLVFPKFLYLVPVYWMCQLYLRSLSQRCFVASIFGVLVPYWILFGIFINSEEWTQVFVDICNQIVDIAKPDFQCMCLKDWAIFGFAVVFFLMGMVDFYINSYRDKTRVRIIYNVVIIYAFATIVFMMLQPQYFHILLPILLVNSSIVGGHYIALNYNKFTHIYCLIILALAIALLIAQQIL